MHAHCPRTRSDAVDITRHARVWSSMLYSPRKRLAVATAVAKEVGLTVLGPSTVPVVKRGLPENVAKEVQDFYLQDDITWQAPGRKDRVIIRERKEGENVKTIIQARYMLMSLAEAHSIYCKESTNTIGLSKCCDLRPKQVKLFDTLPHNVCICPYHENVRLLLKALQCKTGLPETTTEFVNALVCDASNKDCMTLRCPECCQNYSTYTPNDADSANSAIVYQQWQNTEKVEVDSK